MNFKHGDTMTLDAGYSEERECIYYDKEKFDLDLMIRFLEGRLKYPRSWYYTLKPSQVRAIWRKEKEKQLEEYDKYWLEKCVEELDKVMGIEQEPPVPYVQIDGVNYRLTDAGFYDEIDYKYYE